MAKARCSRAMLLCSATVRMRIISASETSDQGFYKFKLKVLMQLCRQLRGGILPERYTPSEHTSAFKTVCSAQERRVMKCTRVADFIVTWLIFDFIVPQDQQCHGRREFAKRSQGGEPNV